MPKVWMQLQGASLSAYGGGVRWPSRPLSRLSGVSARMTSMSSLGPAPPELSPLPRAFFDGLDELLSALRPPLLDAGMTKASARDDGVEVVLAHASDTRMSVWAQAATDRVVVGCSALEEELHVAGALGLIAALLCGEREVAGYDGARFVPDFGARRM